MSDTLKYDETGIREAMKTFDGVVEVLHLQHDVLFRMSEVLDEGWTGAAQESYLATYRNDLQPLLDTFTSELSDMYSAMRQALADMIECDTQLTNGPVAQAVSLLSAVA